MSNLGRCLIAALIVIVVPGLVYSEERSRFFYQFAAPNTPTTITFCTDLTDGYDGASCEDSKFRAKKVQLCNDDTGDNAYGRVDGGAATINSATPSAESQSEEVGPNGGCSVFDFGSDGRYTMSVICAGVSCSTLEIRAWE